MARTYTVHGHIERRDGRKEAFWTRTGLPKSAAEKLAREQRAESGGVARVVPEEDHATKKSSAQLQREIDEVLAKPRKPSTHYRSAVSGRYVQKDSARRRPRTTIKESHATKRAAHATRKLDDFTKAYLEAALWSSTDDDGAPLDKNYDIENFAPEAIAAAVKDATTFQARNRIDLVKAAKLAKKREYSSDAQHGHDFWLTRNGLGAGFWDRGYGDVGERLSDAARTYGSVDLYVGDDGALHFS